MPAVILVTGNTVVLSLRGAETINSPLRFNNRALSAIPVCSVKTINKFWSNGLGYTENNFSVPRRLSYSLENNFSPS